MSTLTDLEIPMIELGTTVKALKHMAMSMAEGQDGRNVHNLLFFLAYHLEHIHEDLYERFEAVTDADRNGPKNGPTLVS